MYDVVYTPLPLLASALCSPPTLKPHLSPTSHWLRLKLYTQKM